MNTNTNAAPAPTIADTGADTLIEDLEYAILSVVQSSGGLDRIREAKDALRTALSTAAQPPADERAAFDRYWLDRQRARGFGAALSDDEMLRNPERRNDELHAWQARATLGVAQQPAPREPLKFSQRKALAICTESQKVSVSEVQRKMQISYAAAQELCQSLVDYGGLVDGFALSPSLKPAQTIGEKP